MKDLVIQGPTLGNEALDTFKVVARPERIRVNGNAARCTAVQDDAETRKAVRGLADYWKLDWAFVDATGKLADYRLLAMDMDSTLIAVESLDEVAALAGCGDAVAAITEAAMRGEISDYAASLRRRVALLAGVDAMLLQRVYDEKMKLNPGAQELIAGCRAAGLRTLLVTGGFSIYTAQMQQRLGFDAVRSNELQIVDGKLTGVVTGPGGGAIVDAQGKAQAVRDECARLACPTDRTIAVGDGANDLAMMALAGVSVAWRAKPVVREQATHALNHAGLDGVLAWFSDTGPA